MKVKKNTFIFMNHFSINSHFSAAGVLASEKHSVYTVYAADGHMCIISPQKHYPRLYI